MPAKDRTLRQPAAAESRALESLNDVRIAAHHPPHQSGSIVLDHRENRSLIDAEIIDVEPTEWAGRGERGIERVEEAVGREQLGAVDPAHREERWDRVLGRERDGAAHSRRADRAVVALIAERRAARPVGMELSAA